MTPSQSLRNMVCTVMPLFVVALGAVWGCSKAVDPANPEDLDEIEAAVKADPGNADAWVALAVARQHETDWSGSIVAATNAIEKNPRLGRAYAVRGAAIMRDSFSGDAGKERAAKDYAKAIEVSPDDAEVWYLCGIFYTDHKQEWDSFSRAIELDPKHCPARRARASLAVAPDYMPIEKPAPPTAAEVATALSDLAIAIEHDTPEGRSYAYWMRGKIMLTKHDRASARADFERVAELNPKLGMKCMRILAEYDTNGAGK